MTFDLNNYGIHKGLPYHLTAIEIKELIENKNDKYLVLSENPNAWNEYFKFAFVRNPFDFLVSLYYWIKNSPPHDMSEYFNQITFNQFIDAIENPSLQPKNFQHGNMITYRRPLKTFIEDQGKIIVDFVGKLENVNEDYQKICDILSINNNLQKSNTSKRPQNYRDCYDSKHRAIVEKIFKEDFDFFGYQW